MISANKWKHGDSNFFVLFFGTGVQFHTQRRVSDGLCLILHCVISYLLEFLTAFPFAYIRANTH